MEYSPKLLASLTIQAFILGSVLGLLYSLLRFSRVLLGERGHPVSQTQPRLPRFLTAKRPNALAERTLSRGLLFLLRFLEDILFCLAAAIGIILLAYVGNNGRIRWFILLGTALGFTCYTLTVGKLFSCISELLALTVRLIFRYAIGVLLFPLRAVGKGIRALLGVLSKKIRIYIRKRKNVRFHAAQTKALLTGAGTGFDCVKFVGLELPDRSAFESADESCKNNEDVKNKRRRYAYGRIAKSEKAKCKSEKACRKA